MPPQKDLSCSPLAERWNILLRATVSSPGLDGPAHCWVKKFRPQQLYEVCGAWSRKQPWGLSLGKSKNSLILTNLLKTYECVNTFWGLTLECWKGAESPVSQECWRPSVPRQISGPPLPLGSQVFFLAQLPERPTRSPSFSVRYKDKLHSVLWASVYSSIKGGLRMFSSESVWNILCSQ